MIRVRIRITKVAAANLMNTLKKLAASSPTPDWQKQIIISMMFFHLRHCRLSSYFFSDGGAAPCGGYYSE